MSGNFLRELYDSLYYGSDIDFTYKSLFYHINSGYELNSNHNITVYQYDKHPDCEPSYYIEIYRTSNLSANENIEIFLDEKIFENKSIYEIYNDIEMLYS